MSNTDIPLKEYFDTKIAALEKATTIAASTMEKRLEGMNEFRQTLTDQTKNFVTRLEHERVLEDIRELRESKAKLEGKASQSSVNTTMIIAIIGILLSVIGLFKQFVH